MTAVYLDRLRAVAAATEGAEGEFWRYAERRVEEMASERMHTHRRYHLVD